MVTKTEGVKKINAFKYWCWRRMIPWTDRRTNVSMVEHTGQQTLLEAMITKQKSSYFGNIVRNNGLEKQPCLEKEKVKEAG